MMNHYFFTSESVAEGHPDKICDQISDAVLDACLAQDPHSKVACETVVTTGLVLLAGEITTSAQVNYSELARETIKGIGYDNNTYGFNYDTCAVLVAIQKQSPDIAQGVNGQGFYKQNGAGDQGIMFGYATDETESLMPLPISLSHQIVRKVKQLRNQKAISYLRPDGKTQVTVEYDLQGNPVRVDAIVLSLQHDEQVAYDTLVKDLKKMLQEVIPAKFLDDRTKYFINPTGRFVIGGPQGDTGLTGRKIIVDTYGGAAHHGGGAFSGKDATKVDRSAAYAARYIAKNIVGAKLAKKCEVQISYAIGIAEPISIRVNSFGTSVIPEEKIEKAIPEIFPVTPDEMISHLQLRRPIFKKTAFGGHFGRDDPDFTWEKLDQTTQLRHLL